MAYLGTSGLEKVTDFIFGKSETEPRTAIVTDPATGNTRTIDDVNATVSAFGTAISNIINAWKGVPQYSGQYAPIPASSGIDFTSVALLGGAVLVGVLLLKKKKG